MTWITTNLLTLEMNIFRPALYLLTGALFLTACGSNDAPAPEPQGPTYRYNYETAPDDPLNALIYTLDNGLKVYMTVYKDEPRIQTAITVRAGSKNDPADATGLAHYLEHMLFKGNSNMGTVNWEEEKVLLDMISDTYETLRATEGADARKKVYQRIDSLSGEAAKFAAANEYDKMVSSLGAKGTNAFTSLERTVYINDIPSNEIEKWAALEGSRFSELTLRLFHTELETVYEEFNRSQDNDFSKVYHTLGKLMYPKHPYGTQTTIGTGEHLKNPSMVKIHEYFDTYYNPNNIAICLSGDLDPDATVDAITKYFGQWESKPLPKFTYEEDAPRTEPVRADVYGPMSEGLVIGWRFGGAHTDDAQYVELAGQLLQNGQAGLMDLNLVQAQKVLRVRGGADVNHDYSELNFYAGMKSGQTMEEVEQLIVDQIEKLKAGDFDDEMMAAVARNAKKDRSASLESNWARAYTMADAFIMRQDWEDRVNQDAARAEITKEQLVAWANKNIGDNYAVVRKYTGVDENTHKVDKPEITNIDINRDAESPFYQEWSKIESSRLKPVFVDYDEAISKQTLGGTVPMWYVKNEVNDIFTMMYVLDMGSRHDSKLALAIEYLPYLGTDKYSAEELQKELFKLGIELDVFAREERIYVRVRGIEESLEEGIQLLEHMLANAQPDDAKLAELISDKLKEREDEKKSKWGILYGGLMSYAQYGPVNPFNDKMSQDELESITSGELIEAIRSVTGYKHRVQYYGSMDMAAAAAIIEKNHPIADNLKDYPEKTEYAELETNENKVYFVDYDMVQTELMFLSYAGKFDKTLMPKAGLFNEYFGSGLSSIVFQEIRESKALAYSAYAAMTTPSKADESHYVRGYIGTQNNKLSDAITAMLDLMNDMPEGQAQFEAAKMAAMKKIETDRITRSGLFWDAIRAQERGVDYDLRKDTYAELPNTSMANLQTFFTENIKGRNYTFLAIGKKEDMDMEALEKLGPVTELKLEELFGY